MDALPFSTLDIQVPMFPSDYPYEPKTLGDHLKKRRYDLKLLQKDIILGDQKLAQIFKNRSELAIKEKGKYIRNYVFGFAELGREATWLADDIKRFMPENVQS
ncbi:MAG: hypothetical protein EOO43_27130 [Flavobacterium sp.]|nr:MAG: hypothetical protein EOO43_27130 [Flavobacterium sp.]